MLTGSNLQTCLFTASVSLSTSWLSAAFPLLTFTGVLFSYIVNIFLLQQYTVDNYVPQTNFGNILFLLCFLL